MARCRNCSRSGLAVRTDACGVCRPCRDAIQSAVAVRLEHVRQALACVRSAKDPAFLVALCDVAIEMVERLLPYEERRLAELAPLPSALLAMLRARKDEASAGQHEPPPAWRPLPGVGIRLQAIVPPAAAPVVTGEVAEDTWWAWQPALGGPLPEPLVGTVQRGEERRRTARVAVRCVAYVLPNGGRATLENLSSGGVFLRTDHLQPLGAVVRLIASTPLGPAKAAGVVQWQGTRAGARGMGLEFTQLSLELLEYLESRLGAPLPIAEPAPAAAAVL